MSQGYTSRRRQLICRGRGQVFYLWTDEGVALNGDTCLTCPCSIIGNSVIVIVKRASTHCGDIAAAIHGTAHHGVALHGDGSVALHTTGIYVKVGGYSTIWSVIHKAIAATVYIAMMDALNLSILVNRTVLQAQLVANGATVDNDGGVAHR